MKENTDFEFKALDRIFYEESRSLNQELTFKTLQAELAARNMEFGSAQKRTLKLVGDDSLYTNLALLLSDQCVHTIRVAVFQGSDNAVFRDRKEFPDPS